MILHWILILCAAAAVGRLLQRRGAQMQASFDQFMYRLSRKHPVLFSLLPIIVICAIAVLVTFLAFTIDDEGSRSMTQYDSLIARFDSIDAIMRDIQSSQSDLREEIRIYLTTPQDAH